MRRIILLAAALLLVTAASVQAQRLPLRKIGVQPTGGLGGGTNPISALRRIDWSTAGVTGGIPTGRTQSGSTISAYTGTAGTINTAITNCGNNQYVLLGAGTFTLSSGILFNAKANCTLRGMGADTTLLIVNGTDPCTGTAALVCIKSNDTSWWGGPSNVANWTAGYAKDATVLTLSSTANLSVGKYISLDQLKDSADDSQIYICYDNSTTPVCAGGPGDWERTNRPVGQMVKVTAINGSNVTVTPGLYMPMWRSGQTPQAFWATTPTSGVGLEDMSIDGTGTNSGAGVFYFNCYDCWMKGVRSVHNGGGAGRSHILAWGSPHLSIVDNYFFGENDWTLVTHYGLEMAFTSDCLIENNIFQQVQAPVPMNGPTDGCVLAYNYDLNNRVSNFPNFMEHTFFCHALQNYVLMEGNIGPGLYCDTFHGSHHFITTFRNRFLGYDINGTTVTSGNTIPMRLDSFTRHANAVCNVLGTDQRPHTVYAGSGDQSIYRIGESDVVSPSNVPDDARAGQTLFRWGNYDTQTNTSRFVSGEVPSSESVYPNSVPATNDCGVNSQYLTAEPDWWVAAAGPWPGIGPDITGGNLSNSDGHANENPAAYCYRVTMSGPTNGSGSPLTFNRSTCYPGS